MDYINRMEKVKQILADKGQTSILLSRTDITCESELLWLYFKDMVPMRRNIDNMPNLTLWCQKIYELLPDDTKILRADFGGYYSCKTAHKKGEPLALIVCSMEKWLTRNIHIAVEKMNIDDPERYSQGAKVFGEMLMRLKAKGVSE